MNAILALSSRHISLLEGTLDTASTAYHHKCLETLIPALNDSEDIVDENLLTAVSVLRSYEEIAGAYDLCSVTDRH